MQTMKKGSKGSDVVLLQQKLGINADGVFGAQTEAAVVAFQKSHGCTPDGIVGAKTWDMLGFKAESRGIDPCVIYKPLSVHVTRLANRKPQYLAIHFTAGSSSQPGRAQGVYNTFVSRAASADFAVDDRDIVQFNPDIENFYCWAVGDARSRFSKGGSLYGKATNRNTISIEICSTCTPATPAAVSSANHRGWTFTDKALDNAARLARIIMRRYNIPAERVVRHYDISGKLCPGIIGWNDEPIYGADGKATKERSGSEKWEAFKRRLA